MRTGTSRSAPAVRGIVAPVDAVEVVVGEQADGGQAADDGHQHHAQRSRLWPARSERTAGCQAAAPRSSAAAGQRASSSVPST